MNYETYEAAFDVLLVKAGAKPSAANRDAVRQLAKAGGVSIPIDLRERVSAPSLGNYARTVWMLREPDVLPFVRWLSGHIEHAPDTEAEAPPPRASASRPRATKATAAPDADAG